MLSSVFTISAILSTVLAAPALGPEPLICSLKQEKAKQGLCLYESKKNVPFANVANVIKPADVFKTNPQVPNSDTAFTASAVYFLPFNQLQFPQQEYLMQLTQHISLGGAILPTEIIGNIGRFLDFKTHTVLRSTCSSVRSFVPRLKVVGLEAYKKLVNGFRIRPANYYNERPEMRLIFQECITLDSHPRTLTMEHINYLIDKGFYKELSRISRAILDDPTTYKDIDLSCLNGFILKAASYDGDLDLFKRLLLFPYMDTPDSRNRSMINAAGSGHLDIVQFLIPSMASESGNFAIFLAAENGHLAVVQALLEDTRVDPSFFENRALQAAARNGHLAVVHALLQDARVDPAASTNSALISAAGNGQLAVVHALLQDPKVDPSALDNMAIRRTAEKGHLAVVQALLQDARVDPTASDNSALRKSAAGMHYDICFPLLADLRVLAHYRLNPFDLPAQVIVPPLKAIDASPSGSKSNRRAKAKRIR